MPHYDVLVTRECTESTTIRVEADNPEDAENKALAAAQKKNGSKFHWELDEDNHNECYICDPGGCAEEVNPTVTPNRDEQIERLVAQLRALEPERGHAVQLQFDDFVFDELDTSKQVSNINNQGYHGQIEALAEMYGIVRATEIVEVFLRIWRENEQVPREF